MFGNRSTGRNSGRGNPKDLGDRARSGIAGRIRRVAGHLFSRRAGVFDWGLLIAAVIYVLVPVDIVPDLLLPFGLLDDAAILGLIAHTLDRRASRADGRSHNP